MFIKYVDAFGHAKDATFSCELLEDFIQDMGVHHIM